MISIAARWNSRRDFYRSKSKTCTTTDFSPHLANTAENDAPVAASR
jgi:hypothetical protein